MDKIASALKVLGHPERLRILALLSRGELTVSEIVQIMGLSQPRVTQYIKSLEDAGIIERLKEGSWVFSRLRRGNETISAIVATTLASLPHDDAQLLADNQRLEDVRRERAKTVEAFFDDVANDRGQLGDEYLPQTKIEEAIISLVGHGPIGNMIDLGTGTGRVLELFSDRVSHGSGLDNNADMLKVARHKLSASGRTHLTVRQGDLHSAPWPDGSAQLVTLHQVLHYLEYPEDAINEAARLLEGHGKLLIVDFVPHDHEAFRTDYAHRRLGFSDANIIRWFSNAGLELEKTDIVPSESGRPDVGLWLGRRHDNLKVAQ